jgi:hypothetical protein
MNPILAPGPVASWDSAGVEQPDLIFGGTGYMLYYDGFSKSGVASIGLARPPQGFLVPEFPPISFPTLVLLSLAIPSIYLRGKRQR